MDPGMQVKNYKSKHEPSYQESKGFEPIAVSTSERACDYYKSHHHLLHVCPNVVIKLCLLEMANQ